jgi:hypothetical protein
MVKVYPSTIPLPSARVPNAIGVNPARASFAWLERAYAERDWYLRFQKVAPYWDSLRADPRFASLLERLHLD